MSELSASQPAAFGLLHPSIQQRLWEMKWESLRPLQADTIRAFSGTSNHLILAAPTAAGKTEAAFLPILSAIANNPQGSVRVLYVGPLKALINDQFSRINDLCGHLEVPVYSWHGDISGNLKAKLIAKPAGVLLITPESMESLFINRHKHLTRVFSGLLFIVIDELHSFLGNERGLHLRSLLTRLLAKTSQPSKMRLVGLSATLGDMEAAKRYLAPDAPEDVTVIEDHAGGKELKLRIHTYLCDPPSPLPEEQYEAADEALDELSTDIVRHCQGASNLVFANSRADVELLADSCRTRAKALKLPDQFLVHHGSLSADIRRDAEETMKAGTVATTFCTPTLELGIDIGAVRMVGQIDPPWSISSLKQRLGRSGRRAGEAQILRMYIREQRPESDSNPFDRLYLDLIRAIASTELLLAKWIEPPHQACCDLSTLTHQIISLIGEYGGKKAAEIFKALCVDGPFRDVEQHLFTRLLRQLGSRQVIEQMEGGDLILGTLGERIYRDFTFYAVFQTPEEYALIHGSEQLGTLDVVPEVGQHLLFAARRWLVLDVDNERKRVYVEPARGRKQAAFAGRGGMLKDQIIRKMKDVLGSNELPVYLDEVGLELLREARATAKESGILSKSIIPLGPKRSCLLTWMGTAIHRTIEAMMITLDVHPIPRTIGIDIPLAVEQVPALISELTHRTFNPEHLAIAVGGHLPTHKFDWVIGPDLTAVQSARQFIDCERAKAILVGFSTSTGGGSSSQES